MNLWKSRRKRWFKPGANLFTAVILIWQPNVEPDLAGYKIYIGEKSRQYTTVINVGKLTQYDLDSLPRNKTHFLAVTAYDASGNESTYSEEVVLTAAGGNAAPPDAEGTLQVSYNFPNPFRHEQGTTTLRYFLAEPARVSIKVYDVKGDLIKIVLDRVQRTIGEQLNDAWDGTDLNGARVSPGLYYVEIQAQDKKTVFKTVVRP